MSKKPRVLMVSKNRAFQGGVERHIMDLTSELGERGFVVELFGSEDVLESGGHVFDRTSSGISAKLRSASSAIWNSDARRALADKIKSFQPDLVHFHSIYHQLSPSVLGLFDGPVIMTLHDYKLAAPCYTLYREGDICRECVGLKIPTPSIKYGCVGNSTTQGLLCLVESVVHRRRYLNLVNRFIVPSTFSKEVLTSAGVSATSIEVVSWGVSSQVAAESQRTPNEVPKVSYVGRLHPSKGIEIVLEGWAARDQSIPARLVIAGDGELANRVKESALADRSIEFLGLVSPQAATEVMASSDIVLMPSLAPETMGLTAVEALLLGVPVISSGRGALSDLAGPGVLQLREATSGALAKCLNEMLQNGMLNKYHSELSARDLSKYTVSNMTDRIVEQYQTIGLQV